MMKITIKRVTVFKYLFHGLILLIIVYPPSGSRGPDPFEQRNLLIHTFPAVSIYLLNIFVFIPLLLKERKYYLFALAIILSLMVFFGINNLFRPQRPAPKFLIERRITTQMRVLEKRNDLFPFRISITIFFVLIGISTSFEMILEWERQRRLQEEIQKEKITAELSLLKSQINPHFLFNVLNGIYSMAVEKMDQTEVAILRLSDMMRYMLYESNQEKVFIVQEIEFIQNYIDLQKMRISSKNTVEITFNYQGDLEKRKIEPIFFIPFVENAFLHGVSYLEPSFIHIDLKVWDGLLEFKILNSKKANRNSYKGHGMGLVNVRKRLDILYPGKHELMINDQESFYSVLLNIRSS